MPGIPAQNQAEKNTLLEQRRTGRMLRWLTWTCAVSTLAQSVQIILTQNHQLIPSAILTGISTAIVVGSRMLVARGVVQPAIAIVVTSFLSTLTIIAFLMPVPLSVLLISLILVAVIALANLRGSLLNTALLGCGAASIIITGNTSRQASTENTAAQVASELFVLGSTLLSLGLIFWLLWQFYQRLNEALVQSEDANRALRTAQSRLSAQNEWLSVTLQSMGDAVVVVDAEGRVTLMNRAAESLTGWKQQEALAKPLGGMITFAAEPSHTPIGDPLATVLRSQQAHAFGPDDDVELSGRDGRWLSITANVSPLFNHEQQLAGAVLILADITAQKQAQRALLKSQEQFARVFRSSLIGIAITTLDDARFIDVNERLLDMLGFQRDQVLGRTLAELGIMPDVRTLGHVLVRLQHERAIRDLELTLRTRDGVLREMLAALESIDVAGQACMILMCQDITDRKLTEQALLESESQYRLIAENTHDLIALLDEHERYVYASPSHQPVLGYHISQLIGVSLFDMIHDDDRPAFQRRWYDLLQTGDQLASARFRHADGTWRWFEVQATAIDQGAAQSVVVVARDTTQRRDLEAQFHQSQKMESIGRLAGGVAHDFNNLLSAINGYTELALAEVDEANPMRSDLIEIQRAASRAATFARQLLTLARKQRIEPQVVNLNDLLLELDRLLRRLLGEDIELVTLLTPEPCMARVDPGQIEQVLINMAVNARDAMPNGGKLVIETREVVLDQSYVRSHVGARIGPHVMIAVTDNGIGMDAEVRRQVFEPFFTTKPPGEGTGLGLATSYGIIKRHDGNILCYSEPGHGTTFKIYLPRASTTNTQALTIDDANQAPRGTETILLAEDEASVRELTARVLRSYGYTVLEAPNGEEALRLAESYSEGPIHLLLSDLVMPQMGGTMLAQLLLARRPNVRVVFMSGYPGNAAVQHGHIAPAAAFIQKPFSIMLLVLKVREVLDR